MSIWLKQSTQIDIRIGPFLDKTTGVDEEPGLAGNGTEISKAGAAYGTGPTLGTHDAEGWYPVTLTTTHTNTLGPLQIKSHDSTTHLPVWHEFMVVPANVYDSLFSTDLLQVDAREWLGGTIATPTVTGVPEVDVTHFNGTAGTFASGRPEVNTTHWAGTAVGSTTVRADLINIAGVAVSTTTAQLGVNVVQLSGGGTAADNAEKFFDGTGYAGTNNTIPTVTNVGTVTGNVNGSVGSVTGAVGSVTGAVGSVTGSVGSVAAGGITASSIATDAIDADALATDAVNEIADGLLNRDMSAGTDSGSSTVRTPRQALRVLRNKVSVPLGTVYKEDDSTSSWTFATTTDGTADPITVVDPTGP